MRNLSIRNYARERRVNLWEVAERLGYSHDSSFSRALRHEFSEEQKEKAFKAIDEIVEEKDERQNIG